MILKRNTRELTKEDILRYAKAAEERKNQALEKLNSKNTGILYKLRESELVKIVLKEILMIKHYQDKHDEL